MAPEQRAEMNGTLSSRERSPTARLRALINRTDRVLAVLHPPNAAKPLVQKIGSADKQEVILKGGHVSLVAGANAIKRLWPKLDSWLGERST